MRKKVIAICMCFTMLFGMLLVNNMGVKAEGDIESQEQEVKDAFEISVTPRNAMEAGKEVILDIYVTNKTDREFENVGFNHNLTWVTGDGGAEWFGKLYDEDGTEILASQSTNRVFAAGTTQKYTLVGILPEDWGRKYCIDINVNRIDRESNTIYSGSIEYGREEPIYPDDGGVNNRMDGYTVSLTTTSQIKAGEQVIFQVSITNRSGVVQKVRYLSHYYNPDNRAPGSDAVADFGVLTDEQENIITEGEALELVFQPEETKKFTLTGTIPENWTECGQVMVWILSRGADGVWYEMMGAYPKYDSIEDIFEGDMNFSDIDENGWYYDAVKYVYERGIMTGTTETEFSPGGILSRAQFATIIYRMEGEPEAEYDGTAFPDVADGAFYTSPAMWAKRSGVIGGYQDVRFGPADDITREQMAVMMYRYAEMLGLDTSARGNMGEFPDAGQVSPFAAEAMKWAVGTGLIRGDQGMIHPQGGAQRDQCATIVMRFMDEVYSDYFYR